jgi:phosphate transport system permease protein
MATSMNVQRETVTGEAGRERARLRRRLQLRRLRDRVVESVLLLSALVAVFVTAAIVYILVSESLPFFAQVPLREFLTDTMWTPMFDDARFGILPLVAGTLVTTGVALCLAIPCCT